LTRTIQQSFLYSNIPFYILIIISNDI